MSLGVCVNSAASLGAQFLLINTPPITCTLDPTSRSVSKASSCFTAAFVVPASYLVTTVASPSPRLHDVLDQTQALRHARLLVIIFVFLLTLLIFLVYRSLLSLDLMVVLSQFFEFWDYSAQLPLPLGASHSFGTSSPHDSEANLVFNIHFISSR